MGLGKGKGNEKKQNCEKLEKQKKELTQGEKKENSWKNSWKGLSEHVVHIVIGLDWMEPTAETSCIMRNGGFDR